jgi:hypothetical protein
MKSEASGFPVAFSPMIPTVATRSVSPAFLAAALL